MVEIIGFPRQNCTTSARFEIEIAPTAVYLKTNYLIINAADSGAGLVDEIFPLSGVGGGVFF